jgi:hypothetical protein
MTIRFGTHQFVFGGKFPKVSAVYAKKFTGSSTEHVHERAGSTPLCGHSGKLQK